MNRSMFGCCLLLGGLLGGYLVLGEPTRMVVAQEEQASEKVQALHERLKVLEQQIEAADKQGQEQRVEELRAEAEELAETLEQFSGNDEFEEEEFEEEHEAEFEELEEHEFHLELERKELEVSFGRLEIVSRVAELAEEKNSAATYAIMHVHEYVEQGEAQAFLEDLLDKCEDKQVKRLLHIKLAEIHAHEDRPEEAKRHLRELILGE